MCATQSDTAWAQHTSRLFKMWAVRANDRYSRHVSESKRRPRCSSGDPSTATNPAEDRSPTLHDARAHMDSDEPRDVMKPRFATIGMLAMCEVTACKDGDDQTFDLELDLIPRRFHEGSPSADDCREVGEVEGGPVQ